MSYFVNFFFRILYPPIVTSVPPLPNGTVGVPYPGVQFSATGGSGSGYSWLQDVGNQPPGLTISLSGVLSGTPTMAGTYFVSVSVRDDGFNEGTASAMLVINPA
jgi:hypothetical protein